VFAVDQPTSEVDTTVDALVDAARLHDVPEAYRTFAEPRRDPGLLLAYASWLVQTPTHRIVPVGLATAGSATSGPQGPETGFAHLLEPTEFAAAWPPSHVGARPQRAGTGSDDGSHSRLISP
jgi:hypothetical protein